MVEFHARFVDRQAGQYAAALRAATLEFFEYVCDELAHLMRSVSSRGCCSGVRDNVQPLKGFRYYVFELIRNKSTNYSQGKVRNKAMTNNKKNLCLPGISKLVPLGAAPQREVCEA